MRGVSSVNKKLNRVRNRVKINLCFKSSQHGEMLLYYQLRGESQSEWLGKCRQVAVGMWGMEDMYHWGWEALRRETKYRKPFKIGENMYLSTY